VILAGWLADSRPPTVALWRWVIRCLVKREGWDPVSTDC
jgi:hypothetical protein